MAKQEKGFTLVELLVVIAIVSIFPMIVISNFPLIKKQFALSRAVYNFAQDVRATQSKSLSSQEFKDQFGVLQPISGYGIVVDTSLFGDTGYAIYADKYPGNHEYDQEDYIVKTVDFSLEEPGIIIQGTSGTANGRASIDFYPPNPDTTITELDSGANSVDIIFSLDSDWATTRSVLINTSGLIEIK